MAPDRREEIERALNPALGGEDGDPRLELESRATGGLSQETWFGRLARPGKAAEEVVLRLPTRSSGAKTIGVQRAALEAVAGTVPAPALVAGRDDGDAAGGPAAGPWMIMERVAGEVPVGWHALEPRRRASLAAAAVDVLADMHDLEAPESLRPRSRKDGAPAEISPAADLAVLGRRLGRLDPLPVALRTALRWLEERCPPPLESPSMIHGDYRMGNIVVDGERIAAVLDWELATLGDPMTDLAWCFMAIWEPAGVDEEPLVERYEQRRGVPVDRARLHWYRAFNFARLVYFALSGSRAFASGTSSDLRLAALGLEIPVRLDRLLKTIRSEEIT